LKNSFSGKDVRSEKVTIGKKEYRNFRWTRGSLAPRRDGIIRESHIIVLWVWSEKGALGRAERRGATIYRPGEKSRRELPEDFEIPGESEFKLGKKGPSKKLPSLKRRPTQNRTSSGKSHRAEGKRANEPAEKGRKAHSGKRRSSRKKPSIQKGELFWEGSEKQPYWKRSKKAPEEGRGGGSLIIGERRVATGQNVEPL